MLVCEVKERVVNLKRSKKYSQANFSHFQELLEEHESIYLSKSSVYRILVSEGMESTKKHYRSASISPFLGVCKLGNLNVLPPFGIYESLCSRVSLVAIGLFQCLFPR